MKNKGAVACGHPKTAEAAAQILSQGGNAFDAVIAAHLAACVAEPILSSLGGGGFLTAHTQRGENIVYDFFAHTPKNKLPLSDIDLYPITADFGETTQEFHIGMGSIAVPGSVRGLFNIHRDLGKLPLSVIAEPAIALAKGGVEVNSFQAYVFDIIKPIYQHDETCFELFKSRIPDSDGKLLQAGETLTCPDLANTIEALVLEGERLFYEGEIANSIINACNNNGGLLIHSDFHNYQVIKRKPLSLTYRDFHIFTNPPPSSGGILIAFALTLLQSIKVNEIGNMTSEYLELLTLAMKLTNKARLETESIDPLLISQHILNQGFLQRYKNEIRNNYSFTRGTTQISVIDKFGNVASLTTSNGEGSGFIAPGTGIILNNMLGEEDLNPGGFNCWKEDQRISSMMAPTILFDRDANPYAIGSGGSNRIRSAILQVLVQLIDYGQNLDDAIENPRIHYENNLLSVEYGAVNKDQPDDFCKGEKIKLWNAKNLFFGGVHAVHASNKGLQGKGDPRRGGVAIIV